MTFEDAFYEINGRKPTTQEAKHALSVARIVKEADLDPILLLYLADTQAQEARKRGLDEVRRATGEAVDRFQAVLPNVAEAHKSIGALQALQSTLQNLTACVRQTLAFGGLVGTLLGLVWALSLVSAWKYAYAQGRDDVQAATHQRVCTDLSAYIAGMSTYWRKLGYTATAEKIGASYDRRCQ